MNINNFNSNAYFTIGAEGDLILPPFLWSDLERHLTGHPFERHEYEKCGTWEYNEQGMLHKYTDTKGYTTTFEYGSMNDDANHILPLINVTIEMPNGCKLFIEYRTRFEGYSNGEPVTYFTKIHLASAESEDKMLLQKVYYEKSRMPAPMGSNKHAMELHAFCATPFYGYTNKTFDRIFMSVEEDEMLNVIEYGDYIKESFKNLNTVGASFEELSEMLRFLSLRSHPTASGIIRDLSLSSLTNPVKPFGGTTRNQCAIDKNLFTSGILFKSEFDTSNIF